MFSLIITIVSVALVAALAVATIFYGGDALTRGQAAARAAAVVNGGEQIMAAVALYRSDRGQVPPTLETLRTEGYLSGFPDLAYSTGFELVSSAYAAPVDGVGDWLYDHDAPHLAFVGELSMEACAEVNRLVSERRIVLNRIDPDPHAQCVVKGAQAPVAVFRHPGEGFDNWIDHPRIPDPTASGTIKRPDLGSDICVYGCEGEASSAPSEGLAGSAGDYLRVFNGIRGGTVETWNELDELVLLELAPEPPVPSGCIDYGEGSFGSSYNSGNTGAWRTLSCGGFTVLNTSEHTVPGVSLSVDFATNKSSIVAELVSNTCAGATLEPGQSCYYTLRVMALDGEAAVPLEEWDTYRLHAHVNAVLAQGLDAFEPFPYEGEGLMDENPLIHRWPN